MGGSKESGPSETANGRPYFVRLPPPNKGYTQAMLNLLSALDSGLKNVQGGRLVLFFSARAGEGKTTVVGELAALLAQTTRNSVAIVDAGNRHDLSAQYCVGSSTTLEQMIDQLKRRPNLAIGSSEGGRTAFLKVSPDSVSTLDDPESWALLKAAFNYVLIEMPSLADSPSALACVKHLDGVVVIIESGRTRWPIAQNAQVQLKRAGAVVLGAFINKRIYYIPQALYNWL